MIYVDDLFAEIGGVLAFIQVQLSPIMPQLYYKLIMGKNVSNKGSIRIPPELFTKHIITEQVMYMWRQTFLQTGNVEDVVALAILHVSSFLISWAQGERGKGKIYTKNYRYTSCLDIVATFSRKGSIV